MMILVRTDESTTIEGNLPDLRTTGRSPAVHMNFDGRNLFGQSGYLSLFRYKSKDQKKPFFELGHQLMVNPTWKAIMELAFPYVHFMFVPKNAINIVALDEVTVSQLPNTGRTPTLFDTSKTNPPLPPGSVRYVPEVLFAGQWPRGTVTITEKRSLSWIFKQMKYGESVSLICQKLYEEAVSDKKTLLQHGLDI